jgi:ADP-heptose:LPS heptosyltransferase
MVLGPADAEVGAALRERPERDGWLVASMLDVPMLGALLTSCRAYLGNDSGVSHLAAAVGTPTATLFGATDPRIWAPRGRRVRVLDDPGWRRLTPDDVAKAVLDVGD